jgi:tRNA dimethylallyltransferase
MHDHDASNAPLAPVPVIVGPTAAGKSALAMHVAEATGALLISADSRQVYRGFDIGTAKPSPDDQRRVAHEGLDVADATDRWHAARWAEAARGWISRARAAGRPVLIVGGTGLWVRALAEPLFNEPSLDPDARAALAAELAPLETEVLRERVRALDPARAHLGRAQLLRAIEVATLSGVPQSVLMAEPPAAPAVPLQYLVVDPGPVLRDRIATRTAAMLQTGWVDEVRALRDRVPPDAPAWHATGYDLVAEVVAGTRTIDAAREAIVIATRQYAKRQRTWNRHQLPADRVHLLSPDQSDARARALAWFQESL